MLWNRRPNDIITFVKVDVKIISLLFTGVADNFRTGSDNNSPTISSNRID